MYTYTDKATRKLNLQYIRLFRQLKAKLGQLPIDELNVTEAVNDCYAKAYRALRQGYYDMAVYAYSRGEERAREALGEPETAPSPNPIDADWVLDYLEEYDPVMLYVFEHEVERKKARLTEALLSGGKPGEQIDKAMRHLALQSNQGALEVTRKATIQAYRDNGVEYVAWSATPDEKLCRVCAKLDGNIYPVSEVPDQPHVNCRCDLIPIVR